MSPVKASKADAISKLTSGIWLQSTILSNLFIFVIQVDIKLEYIFLFTYLPALLEELKYKLVPSSPLKHQSNA